MTTEETKKASPEVPYGVIVALIDQDKNVLVSRKLSDHQPYEKKWQLIWSGVPRDEMASVIARKMVDDETGINLEKERLHLAKQMEVSEMKMFFYVYLVEIQSDEQIDFGIPDNTRTDWRAVPLNKAVVLDLVPGHRTVIRSLLRSLLEMEKRIREKRLLSLTVIK